MLSPREAYIVVTVSPSGNLTPKSKPIPASFSTKSQATSVRRTLDKSPETARASSSSSMSISEIISSAEGTACSVLSWNRSISTCLILDSSIMLSPISMAVANT